MILNLPYSPLQDVCLRILDFFFRGMTSQFDIAMIMEELKVNLAA